MDSKKSPQDRRKFLINLFMGTGLVGSHLTFAGFGLRFLQPVKRERKQRLLVGLKSEMPPGTAIPFKTPEGKTINVIKTNRPNKSNRLRTNSPKLNRPKPSKSNRLRLRAS